MVEKIGKSIGKSLSAKYRQKHLDQVKQFTTDALKTSSKRVVQENSRYNW